MSKTVLGLGCTWGPGPEAEPAALRSAGRPLPKAGLAEETEMPVRRESSTQPPSRSPPVSGRAASVAETSRSANAQNMTAPHFSTGDDAAPASRLPRAEGRQGHFVLLAMGGEPSSQRCDFMSRSRTRSLFTDTSKSCYSASL